MPDPHEYLLSEPERLVIQNLHVAIVNAKAKAHDVVEELKAAEQSFHAALGFLATSNGLGGGTLTPDFTRITRGNA
jgi:hypothetical protein